MPSPVHIVFLNPHNPWLGTDMGPMFVMGRLRLREKSDLLEVI